VKLLFDQNLSPRLVELLDDIYPESAHVSQRGLGKSADAQVWESARATGHLIVTKDADFSEICLVGGFPPKIIWIRRGNCSTRAIADMLRSSLGLITDFADRQHEGVLLLY
jgi:predicted nuclease of predicted toxin-antitoxin system